VVQSRTKWGRGTEAEAEGGRRVYTIYIYVYIYIVLSVYYDDFDFWLNFYTSEHYSNINRDTVCIDRRKPDYR